MSSNGIDNEIYRKIDDCCDQTSFSSPGKSILKKTQNYEKNKINQCSMSRLYSSCSKETQTSSSRSSSNEIQHLAEVTAKQTLSQAFPSIRSLFEPTINIFDSSNCNSVMSNARHPTRFRYYVKPYRGDAYIYPDVNKQRSRSLSKQRLTQKSKPTVWYTFLNQYHRPSSENLNRKQHISWSPVREYIRRGRNTTIQPTTKK